MSAAVSAVQAIVKLHGLVVDRSEVRSLVANVDLNRLNDEQLAKLCRFRPRPVRDCRMREEFVPHCSESCRRALQWEQWAVVRLMWKELLRAGNVSRRN